MFPFSGDLIQNMPLFVIEVLFSVQWTVLVISHFMFLKLFFVSIFVRMGRQLAAQFANCSLSSECGLHCTKRMFTTTDGSKEIAKFVPGRESQSNFSSGSTLGPKNRKVSKFLTPTQPGKGEGIHPIHDPFVVTKANVPSKKVFSNINDDIERRRHLLEKYEKETLFFKKLLAEERIEQQNFQSNTPSQAKSQKLIDNLRSIVSEGEWPWHSLFDITEAVSSVAPTGAGSSDLTEKKTKVDFLKSAATENEPVKNTKEVKTFTPVVTQTSRYFNDLSQYTFPFTTWFGYFHPSHIIAAENVYTASLTKLIKSHIMASLDPALKTDSAFKIRGPSSFVLYANSLSHILQELSAVKDQITVSIYEQKEKLLSSDDKSKENPKDERAEKFHAQINYTIFRKAYLNALTQKAQLTSKVHQAYILEMLREMKLLSDDRSQDTCVRDATAHHFLKADLSSVWVQSVETFMRSESLLGNTQRDDIAALWCEYEKYFLVNELLHCALPFFTKTNLFPSITARSVNREQTLLEEADRSTEARSLFSKFLDEIQRNATHFLSDRSIAAQWNAVVGETGDTEFTQHNPYSSMVRYPYSIFTDHKHMRGITTEMYAHQHTAYYMFMLLKANTCLQLVHLSPLRLYLHHEEEQHLKNGDLKRRPWKYAEFSQAEDIERNPQAEKIPFDASTLTFADVFKRYPQFFHAFLRSSCAVYDLIRFAQRLCFDHCVFRDFSAPIRNQKGIDAATQIRSDLDKINSLRAAFRTFSFTESASVNVGGPHLASNARMLYPINEIDKSLQHLSAYLSAAQSYAQKTVTDSPLNKAVQSINVFSPTHEEEDNKDSLKALKEVQRYIENDLPKEVKIFGSLMERIFDPEKNAKSNAHATTTISAAARALLRDLQNHAVTRRYFTKEYIDESRSKLKGPQDLAAFFWEQQEAFGDDALQQIRLFFTLPAIGNLDQSVSLRGKGETLHDLAQRRVLSSVAVALHCNEILSAICKLWSNIDPTLIPASAAPVKSRDVIDLYNTLPSRRKQSDDLSTNEMKKAMLQSLAVYGNAVLSGKSRIRASQMRLRYFIRSLFIVNPAMEFVPSAAGPSLISGGLYGDHPEEVHPSQSLPFGDVLPAENRAKRDPSSAKIEPWVSPTHGMKTTLSLPISSATTAAFCAHLAQHLPAESFSKSFTGYFIEPSLRFLRNFLVMEPALREKVFQEHPNWGSQSPTCSPLLANSERFGELLKFVLYEMQDVLKDLRRIEGDLAQQASEEGTKVENHNTTLLKVLSNSDYKHLFENVTNNAEKDENSLKEDSPYAIARMGEIARSYPESPTISEALKALLGKQPNMPLECTPLLPARATDGAQTPPFHALSDYLVQSSLFEVSKKLLSSALYLFLRSTYIPNHLQALLARSYANRVGSLAEAFPTASKDFPQTLRDTPQSKAADMSSGAMYGENAYTQGRAAVPEVQPASPKKKHVIVAEVGSHLSYLDYNTFKKFDIAGRVQRYTDLQNRNVSLRVRLEDLQAPSHVRVDGPEKSDAIQAYPYRPLLSVHGIRRLRVVAGEKIGGKILKFDVDKFEKYQDNYEYGVNVLNTLIADSKKSELGEVENVSGEYVPTVEVKVRSKNKGLAGTGREKMLDSVIDWDRVEAESAASYSTYVARKTEKGASAYVGPQATWWKVKAGK